MGLKAVVKKHWAIMHDKPEHYRWIFSLYNRTIGRNKIRGSRGNKIDITCAKLDHNNIRFTGTDNEIIIEPGAQIRNCTFQIMGNNNKIFIGHDTFVICAELWISKDGNTISVGEESTLEGKIEYPLHIAAIEGTEVTVGRECMISGSVEIRTADGHSIVNMVGDRINPSRSIHIGEHVWIGTGAVLTKGVDVIDHCIIGTRSVVTKSITQRYCSVGGNPARILKEGLDWNKELLPVSGDS